MSFYLFPYENIPQNARIIIYGAGNVGCCFIKQIMNTRYCEIVAVADKKCDRNDFLGFKYIKPSEIKEEVFDFVVVAINNIFVAENICNQLISYYKIDGDCIVLGCQREYSDIEENAVEDYVCTRRSVPKIHIGVSMGPGLGDIIFYKRFILELISKIKCDFCIDIYAVPGCYGFVESIYSDLTNINIIDGDFLLLRKNKYNYDIAFVLCMLIKFEGRDSWGLIRKDTVFAKIIENLIVRIKENGLDMMKYTDQYIQYERAKRIGENCYTSFNYSGIFNIFDYHVNIPLQNEAFRLFDSLHLSNYITLTYGWCKKVVLKGNTIDKVWPLEYYEKLVKLLKEKYPAYKLVQVGAKDNTKIAGVDYYAIGFDLEVSKYILKYSTLHIDCEGGLVHLATQLGTKCVVMFGPTHISYYGYKENINIMASDCCCECRHLVVGHECMRGLDKPECMYKISVGQVFEKTKIYLDGICNRDKHK